MHNEPKVTPLDPHNWNNLLTDFVDENYRQLYEYSEFASHRMHALSEYVSIQQQDKILGIANVRIKLIPFTSTGIALISGGPLISNRKRLKNEEINYSLNACLVALKEEYVNRRRLLLRIVCPPERPDAISIQNMIFETSGFKKFNSKNEYRTILLDISTPSDVIRKNLSQKWRNILNKSEKNDIKVIQGKDISYFDQFITLYKNLVERKKFNVDMTPSSFREIQRHLPEDKKFVVHLALVDGQPVAGHIGSYIGDTAVYLFGAANEYGLKVNASYLLQWHAINFAKLNGSIWYDLGGIDPIANPDVYRFKQRMGGFDVTTAGPYENSTHLTRTIVHAAESIYRFVRELR